MLLPMLLPVLLPVFHPPALVPYAIAHQIVGGVVLALRGDMVALLTGGWNRWMDSPNAAPITTAISSVAPFEGMSGGHGSRVVQQRFRGCSHKGMRRNAGPSSCALKLIGTSLPRRQRENRCR